MVGPVRLKLNSKCTHITLILPIILPRFGQKQGIAGSASPSLLMLKLLAMFSFGWRALGSVIACLCAEGIGMCDISSVMHAASEQGVALLLGTDFLWWFCRDFTVDIDEDGLSKQSTLSNLATLGTSSDWYSYNLATLGTCQSVLIRGVASFQGWMMKHTLRHFEVAQTDRYSRFHYTEVLLSCQEWSGNPLELIAY